MTKLNQILSGTALGLALMTGSAAMADQRDQYNGYDNASSWHDRHDCNGNNDSRDCNRDRNQNSRDHNQDNSRNGDYYRHSRYDRNDYGYRYNNGYRDHRSYAPFDRIYFEVDRHHYRHSGQPFWYHGQYVVRAYDPYGRVVFVRIDPYTGAWLGVSVRL